jgi:hypothetical protein
MIDHSPLLIAFRRACPGRKQQLKATSKATNRYSISVLGLRRACPGRSLRFRSGRHVAFSCALRRDKLDGRGRAREERSRWVAFSCAPRRGELDGSGPREDASATEIGKARDRSIASMPSQFRSSIIAYCPLLIAFRRACPGRKQQLKATSRATNRHSISVLGLRRACPGRNLRDRSGRNVAFSCALRRDKLDGSGLAGGEELVGSFQLCAPPRQARRKRNSRGGEIDGDRKGKRSF